MQFCPSFHIVQLMRSGCAPQQACEEVVTAMKQGSDDYFEVGVIALNCKVSHVSLLPKVLLYSSVLISVAIICYSKLFVFYGKLWNFL